MFHCLVMLGRSEAWPVLEDVLRKVSYLNTKIAKALARSVSTGGLNVYMTELLPLLKVLLCGYSLDSMSHASSWLGCINTPVTQHYQEDHVFK